MVNWSPIARKEYAQAIRWPGLWILTLLCILETYYGWGISGGITSPRPELEASIGANTIIAALQFSIGMFLSLAALLIAYRSLIGPPTNRSLTLIAAQPHSRLDIFTGTILGRTTAVWTALTVVVVITGTASIARLGFFELVPFVLGFGAALVYTLVLVTAATSISAVLTSRTTAAIGIIMYYLLGNRLWESVVSTTLYTELVGPYNYTTPPTSELLFVLKRAVPVDAFDVLINTILGLPNTGSASTIAILNSHGDPFGVLAVSDSFATTPLILSPWVSLCLLLAWGIVPLGLSYRHFKTTNLA